MFQGRSQLKNKLLMARNEVCDFIDELRQTGHRGVLAANVDFEELVALTLQDREVITRSQFWELCVQLSIYIRPDLLPEDALGYFVDYVCSALAVPPLAPFPQAFMWSVHLANLFFDWRNTIRKAHMVYGSNVDGVVAMAQNLRLYENSFTSKHCASVFALSKRVTPRDGERKRPYRLSLAEFQELLGRLILVRMCKTDEKRKRRERTIGLRKGKNEMGMETKVMTLRERPDGSGLMRGRELFKAAIQKVQARDPAQIMENRSKAFVLRMEQVLKMVYDKVRGRMEFDSTPETKNSSSP